MEITVKTIQELIKTTFQLPQKGEKSKVMDLKQAISKYIRAGMKIHLGSSYYYPNAIINEILRQFIGKKADFTLISKGININTINLVSTGIAKRAITTFHGDVYPVPRPNPAIQRAIKRDDLVLEEWSLFSFTQRLMAAALDLDFMPTNSLKGSSMEKENYDDFRLIKNPFNDSSTGIVRPLIPDISILHGWAGDPEGNIIILPPYGTLPWGCMASREGVIVSVEKIVPTEFIMRYSQFVLIPGYFVKAICEIPFGAHPHGMNNLGMEDFISYEQDYEFIEDFQKATHNEKTHKDWIREWILQCDNQRDYLKKLGYKRLLFLKGKAHKDSWQDELRDFEDKIPNSSCNNIEMMIVLAARKIKERVIKKGYEVILSGAGSANLAAWLGYYLLKDSGYHVNLAAEMGFLGYAPRPVDPFIFSFKHLPSCKMLTDVLNILGIFVGGKNNKAIGVLGAGQIDRYGNINSTRLQNGILLTGSGGSNDTASSAKEIMVVMEQSDKRLVKRVSYITSPGHRVKTLVTDMGIFEKLENGKELILTHYFPFHKDIYSTQDAIEKIKTKCGWPLKISSNLLKVDPPSEKESYILRLFDPKGFYLGAL